MPDATQTVKNLKIIFGGDTHEIDAEVLIESLVSYSMVLQEAAAYISPNSKVNIKIKATEKGSFELLLGVVAENGSGLFDNAHVAYAAGLVQIVGGLYQFKQWLSKNNEPEAIEKIDSENAVKVKTNNGQIIVNSSVYNIYQTSEKAREGLKNTFVKLQDAEEIESFDIVDPVTDEEIFSAPKEDFRLMATDPREADKRKQKEIRTAQEFSVFKVVFKEKHKWEFFYNGIRIYASITDAEFMGKVSKGEIAFRSGDRMIADIEIIQVFNEAANVFVNDDYLITKVIEHMPRTIPLQSSLGLQMP